MSTFPVRRIRRGGSYYNDARFGCLRTTHLKRWWRVQPRGYIGFRVVVKRRKP